MAFRNHEKLLPEAPPRPAPPRPRPEALTLEALNGRGSRQRRRKCRPRLRARAGLDYATRDAAKAALIAWGDTLTPAVNQFAMRVLLDRSGRPVRDPLMARSISTARRSPKPAISPPNSTMGVAAGQPRASLGLRNQGRARPAYRREACVAPSAGWLPHMASTRLESASSRSLEALHPASQPGTQRLPASRQGRTGCLRRITRPPAEDFGLPPRCWRGCQRGRREGRRADGREPGRQLSGWASGKVMSA
jgi:hypothetical protein